MSRTSNQNTYVIVDNLYPIVAKSMDTNMRKLIIAVSDFVNANSKQLYDIAPYDIIYFRQKDIDNIFKALNITEKQVSDIMQDSFYWNLPAFNPPAAKEPYVVVLMCAIRYCLLHKKQKEAEMFTIFLAFSGKFYASIFAMSYPVAPPSKYRTVMDYVVNNMLTEKFDLRTKGNMFGAIQSLSQTYLATYSKDLTGRISDDEITKGKGIQQLRDREKAFMINIARLYYDAYDNQLYLNYETDNLSDGEEFRLTDNDSMKATRYTENTINYITNNAVSLQICNRCKDQNVKATEIKDIMESIISNKENLRELNRVINILICDFMRNYPGKSIGSIDFIAHSIKMKPNSKDEYINEMKSIVLSWLDENSENYRRRKSRIATATSYYKAVVLYLTLCISKAAK